MVGGCLGCDSPPPKVLVSLGDPHTAALRRCRAVARRGRLGRLGQVGAGRDALQASSQDGKV